ncbi:MAG: hypothetical protein A2913_02180 [Parcubacteria group bacterium RIFCSPLOWO2_01_FULL_40_65]|nr:MAG: hypothetical protein A2734_01665 [Parcubacteria group bacterium RIFCSPHIGHO2_01_FULL_40_30]OHB19155.1 MAG: hypothetical protein A3D40_01360 [Parcubacteria group bacterium RIFCSPHIGHO2_02_FULL_40_12]OHB21315.1 MAG: hypothetical protein A2913_02180 [Parcubacteria group bacterium RIFCSPLOWO2_01_FULL_40_65]OHB23182.1 MAG: hypothetical protein A3I22_02025 [Parcubacteria group bacterium RIFCSPLOWO2_02_FULL_40_12]
MKIVLVHDWLVRLGGAERVLIAFHKIFPEAPIYTLFYDEKFTSRYLPKAKIIPSFLQKIPNIKKFHPWFKILMPIAVESLDLSGFDLIISSSHEFSHGVLTKQKIRHICYYHSPSRILWDRAHDYAEDFKERKKSYFKLFLIKLGQHFLRLWDYSAGKRPDIVLVNSKYVAERIKKYYGREAEVVYPPVEIGQQLTTYNLQREAKGYFLIVSQLYPHKNLDLAINAFKKNPELDLVIIGDGPERKRLGEKAFGFSNIKLLGFIQDEELPAHYENCLGYLICNEEDFGISPIEAMSFGKPVLAYNKGGATETVLEGITGEFFEKLEPDNLAEAVKLISEKIKNGHFSPAAIKKHSEKFGFEKFKKEVLNITENLVYG